MRNTNTSDRAISTSFEYILTLSVGLFILSGLVTGLTAITDSQQEEVSEDRLKLVAHDVAVEAHHLSQQYQQQQITAEKLNSVGHPTSSSDISFISNIASPDKILSETYIVEVSENGEYIIVTTTESRYQSKARLNPATPIKPGSAGPGGNIAIQYDPSQEQFKLTNATQNQ